MQCKQCGEEVDELVVVEVKGKRRKVCDDCAGKAHEEGEVADAALGAVRDMMGYKGKF
jgi:ribosome-binding protein aMBF1 (putative translation factor)